jgi:superfamily II DNA or RNA helicase
MPTKRQVLDLLSRHELLTYLDKYELVVPDRRLKDAIVETLAAAHRVQLDQLLIGFKRAQLQEMCRALGLEDSGREKALFVERLAGRAGKRVDGHAVAPSHGTQAALPTVLPVPEKKPRPSPSTRPSAAPRRPTRPPRASTGPQPPIAPGSRILVRDAEWLVRRVDSTSTGGKAFLVVGISEIVRDKEAIFLDEIEKPVVLDPADTRIAIDASPHYRASLLYMESLLRQTAPTDDNLYIGHRAAMDLVPYQLDPAVQALEQTRQRILVADAVGLGKTLECGVLLSELMRRGRGKRILVLAVKSMLTQFQKEMWSRFSIPLTRLDSVGIQRIRHKIPTSHNPFYYFDKSIISIDTLKQDAEYRTYLENAYWDVIVVDEAHNVAERGKAMSLRSKLAKLLASRSDTLIMLSATPHDGSARSFASLMNMLDPTAIADPEDYGKEDIKGLFIRRFKKDIQDQVGKAFKPRHISVARCKASSAEEQAYETLTRIKFARIDARRSAGQLFKTTLEKALFSSPVACAETIKNRVTRLKKDADPDLQPDIRALERLGEDVAAIGADDFAKYRRLIEVIRDESKGLGWTGKAKDDRLVIFTERIATMDFLAQNLVRDLGLKPEMIEQLDGSMPDVEQQRIVEDFGKDETPVRLLIATDVASEGINLHYLCHKMVHFDIPWSLMVFNQRNGRIDRYGQEHEPRIVYLVTDSDNQKIKGDTRILELLIQKDEQAVKNIGDPSTWMGVYDIDTEEAITSEAIESGATAEQFESQLEGKQFDPLALLLGGPVPTGERAGDKTRPVHSLFTDDYAFFKAAVEQIRENDWLQVEFYDDQKRVELTAPDDLRDRFRYLPAEVWPEDGGFVLSSDKDVMQAEMRRCRKDESAWPRVHYLWPLNPVLAWANDKVLAGFGRHEAPLVTLPAGVLGQGEVVYVMSGLIPNRKSHPLVHKWFAVTMRKGQVDDVEAFADLTERIGLGTKNIPNLGDSEATADALELHLPAVVARAKAWMSDQRKEFEASINVKLNEQLKALEELRKRQLGHAERRFEQLPLPGTVIEERKQAEKRRIDKTFDDFIEWVEDTMTTEDNPFLQVVAVLRGVES